jgi:hypothetical protein
VQAVSETPASDANLGVDDGSEPAQATLPLESVFVPQVEGDKVILDSGSLAPVTVFGETFEGGFPGTSWTLYGSPTWDDTNYDKHRIMERVVWGSSLDRPTDMQQHERLDGVWSFSLADAASAA